VRTESPQNAREHHVQAPKEEGDTSHQVKKDDTSHPSVLTWMQVRDSG
jgi:hypothetical protein